MGLYIPNAKIPVSCNKCYEIGLAHRLRDLGGHCPRMDLHYSPDEQDFKGDRRVDCPLSELPPHGRLIDQDEYRDEFMNGVYELCSDDPDNYRANAIIDLFDDAPTVIEAEEDET